MNKEQLEQNEFWSEIEFLCKAMMWDEDAGLSDLAEGRRESLRSRFIILLNSDQNGAVSDTTGDDSSTSAGNQTPSTETPSSSTKEEVERKLKIAIKALEKILKAQAIDGYIPTFKLPYSARIANDALSQINKGEPGK